MFASFDREMGRDFVKPPSTSRRFFARSVELWFHQLGSGNPLSGGRGSTLFRAGLFSLTRNQPRQRDDAEKPLPCICSRARSIEKLPFAKNNICLQFSLVGFLKGNDFTTGTLEPPAHSADLSSGALGAPNPI